MWEGDGEVWGARGRVEVWSLSLSGLLNKPVLSPVLIRWYGGLPPPLRTHSLLRHLQHRVAA